jgi:hypothetical protein
LIAYQSYIPALGVPQVDVTTSQTFLGATVAATDASIVQGAGFYVGDTPAPTASTLNVVATVQSNAINASIGSGTLQANKTYYVTPYLNLITGAKFVGQSQSFTYEAPLTGTVAWTSNYDSASLAVPASTLPPATTYGFLLNGPNGPMSAVPATLVNGTVFAKVPTTLATAHATYTVTAFASISGATPTTLPQTPLPAGGVTYLGTGTPLMNTPYISVSAANDHSVPPNQGFAADLQLSVGNVATATATGVGFCYGTQPTPTLPACQSVSHAFTQSFDATVFGLQEKTTYYIRAYVQYADGSVAYSNSVQLVPVNVAACAASLKPTVSVASPSVFAVNASANLAYVIDGQQNIVFIDGKTAKVVNTISTSAMNLGVAYDDKKGVIYYAPGGNGTVDAIDAVTGKSLLSASVPTYSGISPILAVNPETSDVYLADLQSPKVYKLSATDLSVSATYTLDYQPASMVVNTAINPANNTPYNKLYFAYPPPTAEKNYQYITVLGSDFTFEKNITGIPNVNDMRFDKTTNRLFVSPGDQDYVIDGATDTLVSARPISIVGQQIRFMPGTSKLYTVIQGHQAIWDVGVTGTGTSTSTKVLGQINPGGEVLDMTAYFGANMLYAVGQNNVMSVIDSQDDSIPNKIPLQAPDSIRVNQSNGQIFVGSSTTNQVYVITCQ